jgi:formamidopyrimidine-DNA glycosylase
MPELPELIVLGKQVAKEITGKQILKVEVYQPKCLNIPPERFAETATDKTIGRIYSRGKWLFIKLEPDHYLLINLGMGADLLYFTPNSKLPEKYQFKLTFTDHSGFTIRFYWFGYIHLLPQKELSQHKLTAKLGVSASGKEFTREYLQKLLAKRKARIKSLLLDQKNIAGIGNVYIQDILFNARLHPNRKANSLSDQEVNDLCSAIKIILKSSIEKGGLAYEKDFYGQKGNFGAKDFQVGYKTGKPCPICSTPIEKIRTGTTSSYICPKCQKL